MKRRKSLARKVSLRPKTPKTRRTQVKTRAKRERRAEAFARAYHSPERVAWVARLPCVVCDVTPCENAHTKGGGTGLKGSYMDVIPLCPACHRTQHAKGWGRLLGISDAGRIEVFLRAMAKKTHDLWLPSLPPTGA